MPSLSINLVGPFAGLFGLHLLGHVFVTWTFKCCGDDSASEYCFAFFGTFVGLHVLGHVSSY